MSFITIKFIKNHKRMRSNYAEMLFREICIVFDKILHIIGFFFFFFENND